VQPLIYMPEYVGNQHPEYSGVFTLTWRLRRPGSYASDYWASPPKRDVDNVPRARPRKPCFPIWGVPPKLGAYSYRGTEFLDVWCTTAPTRYFKKILTTREMLLVLERQHTSSPILWEYLIVMLKTLAPEDAH